MSYSLVNCNQSAITSPSSDILGLGIDHSNGTIQFASKSPAYVFGERVIAPLIKGCKGTIVKLASTIQSLWNNLPSLLPPAAMAQQIESNDCYNDLSHKYPNMGTTDQTIVKTLCENNLANFDVDNVDLETSGLFAISEALGRNTELQRFTLNFGDNTNTVALATALTEGLKQNRNLRSLALPDQHNLGTNPLAVQTFFENLACFNLKALDLGELTTSTTSTAQTFCTTLEKFPYFPLRNFSLGFFDATTEQLNLYAKGISSNRCITNIALATYLGLDPGMMTTLFQAIGSSSTIAHIDLGCQSSFNFSSEQQELILNAVKANICFLNFTTSCAPVPQEFIEKLNEILTGRTPCSSNPLCDISQICPPQYPSNNTTSSNAEKVALIVFAIAIPVLSGSFIGIYCYRKKQDSAKEPLLVKVDQERD